MPPKDYLHKSYTDRLWSTSPRRHRKVPTMRVRGVRECGMFVHLHEICERDRFE